MTKEVVAWSAQTGNRPTDAAALLPEDDDEEDGIEKRPVTPGPVAPAREQLGSLLVEQNHLEPASKEFQKALIDALGLRRAAGRRSSGQVIGRQATEAVRRCLLLSGGFEFVAGLPTL
jgi:hypothetical protein